MQASRGAKLFYSKAKRALWIQVVSICLTFVIYVVATLMLYETEMGNKTPVVLIVVQVSHNKYTTYKCKEVFLVSCALT